MTRKAASDSVTGRVERAIADRNPIGVPEGFKKLYGSEKAAWNQYIQAKTDWNGAELRSLYRLVKNETELARLHAIRDGISCPIDEDGKPAAIYDLVAKQERSVRDDVKILGLNTPAYAQPKNPSKAPGRGKKAKVSLLK